MSRGAQKTGNVLLLLGFTVLAWLGYLILYKDDSSQIPPVEESLPPSTSPPYVTETTTAEQTDTSESAVLGAGATGLAPSVHAPQPASFTHAGALLSIRTLLQQERLREAKAKLQELPRSITSNSKMRSYVATLWNNLGVLQRNKQGAAAAIPIYQEGLALDPESPVLNLNLAHVYWETRSPALTVEFLERLVTLIPDAPFPHMALADRLYERDDLESATYHLEVATGLARSNPELKSYLGFVTAKVSRAERQESQLLKRNSSHFVVKFDGAENYEIWDDVLTILEEAYREIGQRLQYFPSEPIHVVLLTREGFHAASDSPAWADALYDPVLGRIKIPTQGAMTDQVWLGRVLRHEFVHALLHERMGLKIGTLPTWLNEGLAMQLAGDPWPDIDELPNLRQIDLIPLRVLHGGWGRLPTEAASLAYLQGNSATRYMIERYGMGKVHEILDRLKDGYTMEGAVRDKLMMSYETFQKRWTQHLLDKMHARRR